MIDIFHTLEDLLATNIKMLSSADGSSRLNIGEVFLKPDVINMWDFNSYREYYTYFKGDIQFVVRICQKIDDVTTKTQLLKKDLSNIGYFKSQGGNNK